MTFTHQRREFEKSGSESPIGLSGRIFGPNIHQIFGTKCFGESLNYRDVTEYSFITEYSGFQCKNIRFRQNIRDFHQPEASFWAEIGNFAIGD